MGDRVVLVLYCQITEYGTCILIWQLFYMRKEMPGRQDQFLHLEQTHASWASTHLIQHMRLTHDPQIHITYLPCHFKSTTQSPAIFFTVLAVILTLCFHHEIICKLSGLSRTCTNRTHRKLVWSPAGVKTPVFSSWYYDHSHLLYLATFMWS